MAAASDTFAQRNTTPWPPKRPWGMGDHFEMFGVDRNLQKTRPTWARVPLKVNLRCLGADAPIFRDLRRQKPQMGFLSEDFRMSEFRGRHSNLRISRIHFEPKDPKIQFDSEIFTASLDLVMHGCSW